MTPETPDAEVYIEKDSTDYTFVKIDRDDVPYSVLDELEANHVHSSNHTLAMGEFEACGVVVYTEAGEIMEFRSYV